MADALSRQNDTILSRASEMEAAISVLGNDRIIQSADGLKRFKNFQVARLRLELVLHFLF
jgi:hypothetical protein